VAVGVEAARAEPARPAVDVERHHHPVTDRQVLHRRSDLVDNTDELVPECVADPGVRHQTVVEVQVGPADGGELHPDYRVVRVFDRRHRFLLDANFVGTSVRHRFHADRDTRAGRAETAPGEHVESGDRSAANVWDRDHRQAAGSRRA
jgi:hypothetical protein